MNCSKKLLFCHHINRNCLTLVGDLRGQTNQHLHSMEDKMRQLRSEVQAYMNSINYDVNGLLDFKNKTNKSIKINFDSWIKEELRLGF